MVNKLAAAADARGRPKDFPFCPLPSSHIVSSKIKASQYSMHSGRVSCCEIKNKTGHICELQMLAGSTVQRAISTSHKELVCDSNMLPFMLHQILATRNHSQNFLDLIYLFRRTSYYTCKDLNRQNLLVSAGKSTLKIASLVENPVTTLETA